MTAHAGQTMSRWEGRLRSLLLALALLTCAGIALELWFADHDQEFLQLVPFFVCGLGAVSIVLVLLRPSGITIWPMRALMVAAAGVSILGLWEHLESNYGFERDIRPTASTTTVLWHALHGSAPALAPGSLALIALLAVGGTLGHPALAQGSRVRMTAPLPTPVSTKETSVSGT